MTLLLIQMTAVLLTALFCGWLARKLGQSRVIGEIIGGIFLGPSVFGRLAPHASSVLFPPSSLGSFEVLSTIGLILFLFLIGSELDYDHLRKQKATATLASGMSILFPFIMAAVVAHSLRIRFAPHGIGSLPFVLFLGISMSITAFPVLARILEERKMQSTPLGATALMCAAVDDVCAWSLLAIALTLLPNAGSSTPLGWRLVWLAGYLAVMLGVVRPLGAWLVKRQDSVALSYELFGLVIAVVLASAAMTEAIGVHPLFGAFLAGVCFPRIPDWQAAVRTRLDTIVSVLLLPLFFALTGMRTRLDLLSGGRIWLWTGIVFLVAVAGKMGGAVLAARWTGQSWRNAAALGALLNTRGLVELVVLNIAYNAHVFSPTLFTMLVVMALVTTMITTPILNLLGIEDRSKETQDFAVIKAA
ncbi:Kef-type K+ transport system membrane component KefB [Silvibacterium bohemicum]|uniref:Kef-type K+ transport system membrane component KefB n=1 Tax=Silvibacterium bohemicum TaxID=1577686 RepID=A0A841JZH0_9BACT|nr:cation:proton antiporter [Silvibacterium bohemicum]MBB6146045.1 Kef-type K+ transport system membrane component KefB [Silvibacterium bohemicum]